MCRQISIFNDFNRRFNGALKPKMWSNKDLLADKISKQNALSHDYVKRFCLFLTAHYISATLRHGTAQHTDCILMRNGNAFYLDQNHRIENYHRLCMIHMFDDNNQEIRYRPNKTDCILSANRRFFYLVVVAANWHKYPNTRSQNDNSGKMPKHPIAQSGVNGCHLWIFGVLNAVQFYAYHVI